MEEDKNNTSSSNTGYFTYSPDLESYVGLMNDDVNWELDTLRALIDIGSSTLAGPTLPDGRDITMIKFNDMLQLSKDAIDKIFVINTQIFECIIDNKTGNHHDAQLGINSYIPTWGTLQVNPSLYIQEDGSLEVRSGTIDPGLSLTDINDLYDEDRINLIVARSQLQGGRREKIDTDVLRLMLWRISANRTRIDQKLDVLFPNLSISLPMARMRGLLPNTLIEAVDEAFSGRKIMYFKSIHSRYGN